MKTGKTKLFYKILVVVAVVLATILVAGIWGTGVYAHQSIASISINGKSYNVYLATTAQQQEQGLMNRTTMGGCNGYGNCLGMLFVFKNNTQLCFWMKDTKMPLEQYWIRNNTIYTSIRGAPYSTKATCNYGDWVLETNTSSNVSIGQKIFIEKILG
jgi:uncharacterized membrane protein (UPF0127 family)